MYKILAQFKNGLLTEAEALNKLDRLHVRGAFSGDADRFGFLGYDYNNQVWVAVRI